MQQYTESTAVREGNGPRLPSGGQVGSYLDKDGVRVWERKITQKHILRFLDALTVNARLLRQVREDGVQRIRYELAGNGAYEISLAAFLERCSMLQGFARGEDVYALPRCEWEFTPLARERPLVLFKVEDD